MTLRSFTTLGVTPTPEEVTDAVLEISGFTPERRYQFAAALGSLHFVIEDMASNHSGCSSPGCPVCWDLRQARAVFAALDRTQGPGITEPMFRRAAA